MAEREQDERIKALYDAGLHVYSYSRLNTIDDCKYSAYLTYVKRQKGLNSVYGVLGGKVHDAIENVTAGKATPDVLLPSLESDLDDLEMLGLEFPHDFKGGNSIRDKWVANMTHFCKTFTPFPGKYKIEELLILDVGNNRALIGYADLIREYDDGSVQVLDLKTSSQFNKDDLIHHGRQLVIYTMALKNMGYKVRNPAWIMLKYAQITYPGRTKQITKVCDRCKIYYTIHEQVEYRLGQLGITGIDAEILMNEFRDTNTLDKMPDEIKNEFKIEPYHREYAVTPELEQACLEYINRTASEFESLNKDKESDWTAKEITQKESFFCGQLCQHRKTCKYLADYLASLPKKEREYDGLF